MIGLGGDTFVYVFIHPSREIVKIGKTKSLPERANSLGLTNIDLGISVAVQRSGPVAAMRMERRLHERVKNWRIDSSTAERHDLPNDGVTEWFYAQCLRDLFAEIVLICPIEDRIGSDELRALVLSGRIRQVSIRVSEETAALFHKLARESGLTYAETFEAAVEALRQSMNMARD